MKYKQLYLEQKRELDRLKVKSLKRQPMLSERLDKAQKIAQAFIDSDIPLKSINIEIPLDEISLSREDHA